MKLKELAKVLCKEVADRVEVRQETANKNVSYDILCQGARSRRYCDKKVVNVYPIVFNGEAHPSLVVWVR